MIAGLVEAAGQVSGERLLVTSSGVFVQLAAGNRRTGGSHGQQLRTPGELCVFWIQEEQPERPDR